MPTGFPACSSYPLYSIPTSVWRTIRGRGEVRHGYSWLVYDTANRSEWYPLVRHVGLMWCKCKPGTSHSRHFPCFFSKLTDQWNEGYFIGLTENNLRCGDLFLTGGDYAVMQDDWSNKLSGCRVTQQLNIKCISINNMNDESNDTVYYLRLFRLG